jgi:DNA primase
VGSKGLRYINANPREEAVPAKDLLFGQDLARHAIVVVEGPFDAFRIGPGAVATMGLSYSREQLFKMSQYPVRVICFDQEDKAQQRARGLANDLLPFPGKTSVVVPQSADPGDMSEEEVREIRRTFLE